MPWKWTEITTEVDRRFSLSYNSHAGSGRHSGLQQHGSRGTSFLK